MAYDLRELSKYTLYWSVRAHHNPEGRYLGVCLMVHRSVDKTLVNKEFRFGTLEEAIEEAIIWLSGEGHFTGPARKKKPPPKKKERV
jgi:hypothetical protein